MLDTLLPFFFVGILAEIAILSFLMFRRAQGSCLVQLVLAVFAFFTILMVLLVMVGMAEKPLVFTDQGRTAFPAAFVMLGLFIVAALGSTRPAERARERKRPLLLDMLGCLVMGIVGIISLVAGIAILIVLAR
jgi:uncharacterized membrane protein